MTKIFLDSADSAVKSLAQACDQDDEIEVTFTNGKVVRLHVEAQAIATRGSITALPDMESRWAQLGIARMSSEESAEMGRWIAGEK